MMGSCSRLLTVVISCLVICTISVTADVSGSDPSSGSNPCFSKLKCHECIRTSSCAWCAQPGFSQNRCFRPNLNHKILEACPEEFIVNPDNVFSILRQKNLTKGGYIASSSGGSISGGSISGSSSSSSSWTASGSSSSAHGSSAAGGFKQEAVQIRPQEVNLKLRINEAYRMTFAYSQAEDYPVDLYYLMDLSKSMEDDQKKLSALGNLLVNEMSKITSNFRLGFGSFVDKVVMPYVNTMPKSLIAPCKDCAAPYGYRNVMTLSTDTSAFASLVSRAEVSGNLDAPEGGFDAIMQAIVCRKDIGWREKARRLLVFSTDAGFHYAGDGKLGGIIKPNDGECHLDRSGLYTHSSLQDYPSISQINLKVKQNSINIIWAVTEEQVDIYKRLSEHIEGSSWGRLSNDSSNIVELIKEQYDKISSSVEMKDTASSMIKVKYYSKCLGNVEIETSKCDDLKVGNVVEFTAVIEVIGCPTNRSQWHQTFEIYPVGINETLTVNLEMICDCDCENSGSMYQPSSPNCSGVGTLACGICDCYEGAFGNACQCTSHGGGPVHSNEGCHPKGSNIECSGRGDCICGQCHCNTHPDTGMPFGGSYCECDILSCERHDGEICGGHGTCQCDPEGTSFCSCHEGWTGTNCGCSTSTDTCMGGNTHGKDCSGRGKCVCGKCECFPNDAGEFIYTGDFCQKCPSCPSHCAELRACVQCIAYKTGNYTEEECYQQCNNTKIFKEMVKVDTIVLNIEKQDEEVCMFTDEEDCKNHFKYYQEDDCLIVEVQRERECPAAIFVPGIILGVIAAIVLIGLAFLLLWKMVTTIHDRREFARFEKERMMAKWDTGENPIYKQATSTFKNPTYAGK